MNLKTAGLFLIAVCVFLPQSMAEIPEPAEIVDRVVAAAGGEAFEKLGVLALEVEQEETRNDGSNFTKEYTVVIDCSNLGNLRMEYSGGVVVARNRGGGWSSNNGVIDDRRQTPAMATKSLNQTVFPLLLPFTLKMEGVWVSDVREMTWEDREVWVLTLPFSKDFFINPVLTTKWYVVVAKDDYSIIATEFIPAVKYRKMTPEGVRYRILKTEDFSGARIPTQLLAIGIDVRNIESGHHRVTKMKPSVRLWEPALFLSPAQLEALEEDD